MNNLIHTVTAVPEKSGSSCRCLGYFRSFRDALNEINKHGINGLDEGGLFKYLVVEKFETGFYATSVGAETWFEVDYSTNSWVEGNKPSRFEGTVSYGMG